MINSNAVGFMKSARTVKSWNDLREQVKQMELAPSDLNDTLRYIDGSGLIGELQSFTFKDKDGTVNINTGNRITSRLSNIPKWKMKQYRNLDARQNRLVVFS